MRGGGGDEGRRRTPFQAAADPSPTPHPLPHPAASTRSTANADGQPCRQCHTWPAIAAAGAGQGDDPTRRGAAIDGSTTRAASAGGRRGRRRGRAASNSTATLRRHPRHALSLSLHGPARVDSPAQTDPGGPTDTEDPIPPCCWSQVHHLDRGGLAARRRRSHGAGAGAGGGGRRPAGGSGSCATAHWRASARGTLLPRTDAPAAIRARRRHAPATSRTRANRSPASGQHVFHRYG